MATKLIGVTLPEEWLTKIDTWVKNNPMSNRQDFIRDCVKIRLAGCKDE